MDLLLDFSQHSSVHNNNHDHYWIWSHMSKVFSRTTIHNHLCFSWDASAYVVFGKYRQLDG